MSDVSLSGDWVEERRAWAAQVSCLAARPRPAAGAPRGRAPGAGPRAAVLLVFSLLYADARLLTLTEAVHGPFLMIV